MFDITKYAMTLHDDMKLSSCLNKDRWTAILFLIAFLGSFYLGKFYNHNYAILFFVATIAFASVFASLESSDYESRKA